MTDLATVDLKRCPGWDKRAHALPATSEYFHRNTREDKPGVIGLAGYCKVCTRKYAAYQREQWRTRRDTRKQRNEAVIV
jgi:hypothetical protein